MAKAEVIVNGIYVNLDNDFSITIEKNSRLTQFKNLIDTWAYDITFPRTETNEVAFEHAERFEKKFTAWQEYPFKFFFNGRLILNGKIKAKYKDGKYSGYAFGRFGSMASSDIAKKISNLTFPTLTFTNKAEYTPGTDPYCVFPVYNPYYYWGRGRMIDVTNTSTGQTSQQDSMYLQWIKSQLGKQNRFDDVTDLFIEPAGTSEKIAVISPFMFAWYMAEKILSNFSLKVNQNVLKTETLLKTLCIYTSMNIAKIDYTTIISTSFDNIDFGNYTWEGATSFEVVYGKSVSDFNPANLLPKDWSVKDYLIGLQNSVNILFDFNDSNNEVNIIDREAVFSGPATDINDKLIKVPELDPEKNKKVVLKFGIDENDGIWADNYTELSDEQWERFKGNKTDYATLDALTDMEIGDIWFVTAENQYREYRKEVMEVDNGGVTEYNDVFGWYPLSIYGQPLTIGNADDSAIDIESRFGVVSGWPNGSYLLLTGNNEEYKDEWKDFLPRIMFYRGLNGGVPEDDQLGGSIEPRWREANGLYEKRWKHTVNAIKNGIPGYAEFDYDEIDFQELNLNKKYRVQEGAFIIEKSQTTFTMNDIEPTQADILKLT